MEHLRSLTDSLGAEPLDSAVEEYALQVIADEDVEDGLSTVSDLLSGTLPEFASLGEERQTVMLIELWAKVRDATAQPDKAGPGTTSSGASADTLLQRTSASQSTATAPHQHTQPQSQAAQEAGTDPPEPSGPPQGPHVNPDVQQLQELCPSLGADYLSHVLDTCRSVQAAVEWLLDGGEDLSAREAAWREARDREAELERERSAEEKRVRQQVLARFDLQKVELSATGKAPKARKQVTAWSASEGTGNSTRVRYLEGQPVTTKGEKYIVQKTSEDWDGGSRGKVYTKGKRGKGFA